MPLYRRSRPFTCTTDPIGTIAGSAARMPSATRVPEAVREPEQYAVAVNVTGVPAGTPPDVSGGMMSGGGAGRIRPVQPVVITINAAPRDRRHRPQRAARRR